MCQIEIVVRRDQLDTMHKNPRKFEQNPSRVYEVLYYPQSLSMQENAVCLTAPINNLKSYMVLLYSQLYTVPNNPIKFGRFP